jgi:xanthine dehydrogenase molybdopterin-binding subunit B
VRACLTRALFAAQVTLIPDAPNPLGILSSKATGEPSYALGATVHFAVRYAIGSARQDAGASGYFALPAPATPCTIATACLTTTDSMVLMP